MKVSCDAEVISTEKIKGETTGTIYTVDLMDDGTLEVSIRFENFVQLILDGAWSREECVDAIKRRESLVAAGMSVL